MDDDFAHGIAAGIRIESPEVIAVARRIMEAVEPDRMRTAANWALQWQQTYTADPAGGIGTLHYERHGTYSEWITLAEAQRRGIT